MSVSPLSGSAPEARTDACRAPLPNGTGARQNSMPIRRFRLSRRGLDQVARGSFELIGRDTLNPQCPAYRSAASGLLKAFRSEVQYAPRPNSRCVRPRPARSASTPAATARLCRPSVDSQGTCGPAGSPQQPNRGWYDSRVRRGSPGAREDRLLATPRSGHLPTPVSLSCGYGPCGAVSERMSIRHPVSRAASRAFWPSRPIANDN